MSPKAVCTLCWGHCEDCPATSSPLRETLPLRETPGRLASSWFSNSGEHWAVRTFVNTHLSSGVPASVCRELGAGNVWFQRGPEQCSQPAQEPHFESYGSGLPLGRRRGRTHSGTCVKTSPSSLLVIAGTWDFSLIGLMRQRHTQCVLLCPCVASSTWWVHMDTMPPQGWCKRHRHRLRD